MILSYQVIRDCPVPGYNPCNFVYPSNARHWRTIGVQWSPVRGDNNILLTVQLPEEGRNALAIVQAVREPLYSENAPQFIRYDYGTWNPGGQGITVSGRRPDHRVVIADSEQQPVRRTESSWTDPRAVSGCAMQSAFLMGNTGRSDVPAVPAAGRSRFMTRMAINFQTSSVASRRKMFAGSLTVAPYWSQFRLGNIPWRRMAAALLILPT